MATTDPVRSLAGEFYTDLARRFPVCCWSDEFVFFPQGIDTIDWSAWDDLSPDSVEDCVAHLRRFRDQLGSTGRPGGRDPERDGMLSALLCWVAQTLEEQFTLVRTHSAQPTFALTIATVGIIQALRSGEKEALRLRLGGLPAFLERSFASLDQVPELYRALGVEMAEDIVRWLKTFGSDALFRSALESVLGYADRLGRLHAGTGFPLPLENLERAVHYHTGSALSLKEALEELEEEAAVARARLEEEADRLGYEGDWDGSYAAIAGDRLPEGGARELLHGEIRRLKSHCRRLGILEPGQWGEDRLAIEYLPRSLTSIRSADSYNATPGHPFRGGVFYIFQGGSLGDAAASSHPVYRMTAAHEVYPGHHLLDLARWSHPDPALRPVEYPLFYEGWACFGEDLMLDTGAFDRPYDRLILYRRRFRHALRGTVDLKLHSGMLDLHGAAQELLPAGFSGRRALETVRKYALRPAYQMCYTIGRRKFQRLYDTFGHGDVPGFVKRVLSSGELLFNDLERVFQEDAGRRAERNPGN